MEIKKFTEYKGFKIEYTRSFGYYLWGKSLFNPVDMIYGRSDTLADSKATARNYLKVHGLKTWPVLFPDRICS